MKTFVAMGEKSGKSGHLTECFQWAISKVESGDELLVHVMRCRAGESRGRILAEVSEDGVRYLDGYAVVEVNRLVTSG